MAITTSPLSPLLGVNLDAKTSAAAFPLGTAVMAKDGFRYLYVLADTAHASTANIIVSSGGSFSADTAASAGAAGFVCRTTGGVARGQYFWARAKKLEALT